MAQRSCSARLSIHPNLLIPALALLAYGGAFLLGHGTDSYADLAMYRSTPLSQVALNPVFNRYPMWGLAIYPALLLVPLWLAHLLIVAAHTGSSMLLAALLRWFGLDRATALLAAMIFLLWPAHGESLFWISGSMFVFSITLTLAGALCLIHGWSAASAALVLAGLLCTEAMVIPALFLLALLAVRTGMARKHTALLAAAVFGLYMMLHIARYLLSGERDFAPYAVGPARVLHHAVHWIVMSLGLASSHDVAWMWKHTAGADDVGLLLPIGFLLLAAAIVIVFLLAAGIISRAQDTHRGAPHVSRQGWTIGVGLALVGYTGSMLIFLIVQGNDMQSRYTSIGVAYLAVGLALTLGRLLGDRRARRLALGGLCATLLLSWSLYRAWGNIWVNWYPARLLSERLVEDMRYAHQATGSDRLFLVNPPPGVGNAFAIGRDWGYRAAGRMLISPTLEARAETLGLLAAGSELAPGSRFSEQPCTFLGWDKGRRIVTTRVFEPRHRVILNCETGLAEDWQPGDAMPLVYYDARDGRLALQAFLGQPVAPLELPAALAHPR